MATETIRFSRIVEAAGQPETYTLWVPPDQDKVFAKLLRQNRVMTVHQEATGSKADYGTVGYTEDRHRSLLVFPRSLKRFAGQRVIGIKYDELKGPASAESTAPAPASSAPSRRASPASKPKENKPPSEKPAPKKAPLFKEPASPPPPNQIPFPKPEIFKREKPAKPESAAAELASLKKAIKKALDALAQDKPVTAFNLLQATLESE